MIPRITAGKPSTRNMKRHPEKPPRMFSPWDTSHDDSGAPMTLDSGIASMKSAVARARRLLGNQYVR